MRCSVAGCANTAEKRTWCGSHYSRWRKRGDVEARIPLRARFDRERQLLEKIRKDPESGHWYWTGHVNKTTGYGMVSIAGRPTGAHRAVYELLVGPIPKGMEPDHVCRVRDCVNVLDVNHIEVVTRAENQRRACAANRRDCCAKEGHPFDEENTYYRPGGGRTCRACKNANTRKAYRQQRELAA